jgi:hypothetical protein
LGKCRAGVSSETPVFVLPAMACPEASEAAVTAAFLFAGHRPWRVGLSSVQHSRVCSRLANFIVLFQQVSDGDCGCLNVIREELCGSRESIPGFKNIVFSAVILRRD